MLSELPQVAERAAHVIGLARDHAEMTTEVAGRMGEIAEAVALNSTDLDRIGSLSGSLQTMSGELAHGVDRFRFAYSDANPALRPSTVPV